MAGLPEASDEIPGSCGKDADVEVELGREIGSRVGGGNGSICGPSSITDRNGGRSGSKARMGIADGTGRGSTGARTVASLTVGRGYAREMRGKVYDFANVGGLRASGFRREQSTSGFRLVDHRRGQV